MPALKATQRKDLFFVHIPLFAKFILDGNVETFVRIQIRLSRDIDLPVLKYFSHMSEAELITYSIGTSTEFLKALAENRAYEHLSLSLNDWRKNQLKGILQEQVMLDDLFLITRIRKNSFMEMVRLYTTDINVVYEIVDEFDRFFLAYDRETTTTYIELLQQRIMEESYFKEKLAETSPGFYYTYDILNDRQIQKTEKLFRYLGYTPEEYGSDDRFFRTLIHPDDLETADKYVEELKTKAGEEVHFFEYRLKDKKGEYRWMRNYESIFKKDAAGRAEHILGVAFDITKEHFITEELKKSELELLEAQELANMGSFVWDIKTNKRYITKQAQKILGVYKEEMYNEGLSKIHPSDKKNVDDAVAAAMQGNGIFEAEYRINVEGEEKIIWSRGRIRFENGEPLTMKGTMMDVTDKHYMIMKLKRSEELYKQAQALNKLGNWTWEIKTDNLNWSDELYRIYGMEPQSEKINFEKFTSFIHPDDREDRIRLLQEQMSNPGVKEYYFRIIARDGTEKTLYGQSQVLSDEGGVPYKIIGTCQDVSTQKELENTLYKKTVQLERSNESLEEFAYISSHDLKEPLRKISVFIDKFRYNNEDKLDKESKETLNKIVLATGRMQRMVDEILALSRITSEHSFNKYNLGRLLDEVTGSIDSELAEHNAKVIYKNLPDALINETQFRQLFLNLISNSLKFRKENTDPLIEITYRYLPGSAIEKMQLEKAKKYLEIIYKDNGIGFGEESASKIFTIFHRLHTRDKYEGTGIGLALCKKIVEHHLGIIRAKGEVGKGAEFLIIIPA